jgi:hypothetical protein
VPARRRDQPHWWRHGATGRAVGWVMAHRGSNRQHNLWVVSLLSVQPTERVLEGGRIALASQPRCAGATADTTARAGRDLHDRLIQAGFTPNQRGNPSISTHRSPAFSPPTR